MAECTLIAGSGRGAAGLPYTVWALNQVLLLLLYSLALTIRWERVRKAPTLVRWLFLDFGSEQRERRSTQVFFLDCMTKQLFGFVLLSLLNSMSESWLQARAGSDDACDVSWWSIVLQATVGTVLVRLLKMLATSVLLVSWRDLSAFGEYKGCGTVVQGAIAAKQLAVWLVLVLVMKLLVVALQLGMGSRLFSLRRFLGDRPQLELFVVLFLTPAVLNTYMYLAFDSINSGSHLPWETRPLEFDGTDAGMEDVPNNPNDFLCRCCEDEHFAHYYGFSSFGEGQARRQAAKEFYNAHSSLEGALEVQRMLVVLFNERLDLGGGGSVQQWQFVDICRTNRELLKLFHPQSTNYGVESSILAYGIVRKEGEDWLAALPESEAEFQPALARVHSSRIHPMERLRRRISPQRILAWASFLQDVFMPKPGRQAVRFSHVHGFFHKNSGGPEVLRTRLQQFRQEEQTGIQQEVDEPQVLPSNLPRWGDYEFNLREVDVKVAKYVNSQGGLLEVAGAEEDSTLTLWDHNEEVVRKNMPLQAGAQTLQPSMNHCLGPAVQWARCGVVINTLAWFLMPWVAQSTMNCSPLHRGFADHVIPSWGMLFDICCLLTFIAASLRVQREIMRYLVLGQVCRGPFKLELPVWGALDFSQFRYKWFLWTMQVLTALNLLNTWTNAEVFGRVLTTVNWCTDNGGAEVTRTWMKVVRSSGTLGWVDPDSNFLVVTSLVYCLIFSQAIFSVIYSCPLDSQVNYDVGQPYEGHHGYRTMFEPTTGTGHKAVVQTLSALVPYEAVIFQDATVGLLEMTERMGQARYFTDNAVQGRPQPRGSLVAHAIVGYVRELQAQLQRFLGKLILVGFFQNALQTKLQMTFLSLDWNRKGVCDPVFCLGIFGNLLGYFMSAVETADLVKLASQYYSERKDILAWLSDRNLNYEQSVELAARFARIRGGFFMGLLFVLGYIIFFVYLLINGVMIFVCDSHIWNLSLDPQKGCFDPDAVD